MRAPSLLLLLAFAACKPAPQKPGPTPPTEAPVEVATPGVPEAPARHKLADKILACPEGAELLRTDDERWCEKTDPATAEKVKHGPSYKFHSPESIAEQGQWNMGKRDGKFITYYEDGAKKAEATFAGDVQDGPYRAWRKDGSVEADVMYKQGRPARQ